MNRHSRHVRAYLAKDGGARKFLRDRLYKARKAGDADMADAIRLRIEALNVAFRVMHPLRSSEAKREAAARNYKPERKRLLTSLQRARDAGDVDRAIEISNELRRI